MRAALAMPAALLALSVLALALRFYRLGEPGFWRDEATAAFWSQMSLGELLKALRNDVHAPLYYVLLGAWSRLAGTSEWGLRSLGAVLGAAGAPLAVWAFSPLLGRWHALLAGLLMAVMPGAVYYSQQVAVYPLVVALAIGALGATMRLLLTPQVRPAAHATILALCLAGMVYTHMWAALAWAGLGLATALLTVGTLWRARRWAALPWPLLAGHVGALLLWAPWMLAALAQARSRAMDHLPPTPRFPLIFLQSLQFWYNDVLTVDVVVALIVFAVLQLFWTWRRSDERVRLGAWLSLLLMLLVPHAACLATAPGRDIYYARYTLVLAPAGAALLLAAARIIPHAAGRLSAAAGITLLVVLLPWIRHRDGFGTFFMASNLPSPLREVAGVLKAQAGPKDVIVVYPEIYAPSLNWYLRGPQAQICFPTTRRVEVVDYGSFADRIEDPQAPARALEATLATLRAGEGRLWLIYNAAGFTGRKQRIDYGERYREFTVALAQAFPGASTIDRRFWNVDHPYALESVLVQQIAPVQRSSASTGTANPAPAPPVAP